MLEASLILQLEEKAVNMQNNINWTVSCDYGGEGGRMHHEAHLKHYVYVALKPLPQMHRDGAAAASAHQHAEHFGERAAAESAQQHDELIGERAADASYQQHDEPIDDIPD